MHFYKNTAHVYFKMHLMNKTVIPEFLLYKKRNFCLGLEFFFLINKDDIVISSLTVNTCFG